MRDVVGAVLAGGRSTRFGSDKALAMADGKPLLDHALLSLRAVVADVVVCGRDWPGVTALADRPSPGLGPLGGLNAALRHAAARQIGWVLTVACDTPFIAPALFQTLLDRREPAILQAHPVIGLWRADSADRLDAWLADGTDRSIKAWARACGMAFVAGGEDIANFNRAEDLRTWLRHHSARAAGTRGS